MRRLKKMEVQHYSLTLESSVKRLAIAMENRVDVDRFQDILFGLLLVDVGLRFLKSR